MRWPAREEACMPVGPVTVCARDEARLGWSPGGGGAAGSDRSGGEDEATEKKAWQLLDPVGEDEAMEKKASATGSSWRRRRRRQRGRELREKGVVYKGGPIVPGDC